MDSRVYSLVIYVLLISCLGIVSFDPLLHFTAMFLMHFSFINDVIRWMYVIAMCILALI